MKDSINRAAVAFAFDHGPLTAAGQGEVEALDRMGKMLMAALSDHGLQIVPKDVINGLIEDIGNGNDDSAAMTLGRFST